MNKITLVIASVLSIIAGLLHTTIVAFQHIATPPLETIFFLTGGIVQFGLGVLVLSSKKFKHAGALFVVNGVLSSFWVLTRVFRAPFMDSPEGIVTLGLSIFLLQLGSMLFLCSSYAHGSHSSPDSKTDHHDNKKSSNHHKDKKENKTKDKIKKYNKDPKKNKKGTNNSKDKEDNHGHSDEHIHN
jgi:hypothetical protein